MAQRLIAGIYPAGTTDPKALETALTAQNVDASRIKVVTKAAPSQQRQAETPINFVVVAQSMEANSFSDDMTHGMGIMTDSGGTGVPGVGGGSSLRGFNDDSGPANYLTGFAFATDEVDNFNDAIEDGYAVVMVEAGDDEVPALTTSLKAAGLKNVRAF